MKRCLAILLLLSAGMHSGVLLYGQSSAQADMQSTRSHSEWVFETLKRMIMIKPGMTRNDLLKVFTTEGGLSTGLQRTFVSRECSYFKVDVEFEAVGRPSRDRDGRITLKEDGRDIIVKISKPYLAFPVSD